MAHIVGKEFYTGIQETYNKAEDILLDNVGAFIQPASLQKFVSVALNIDEEAHSLLYHNEMEEALYNMKDYVGHGLKVSQLTDWHEVKAKLEAYLEEHQ